MTVGKKTPERGKPILISPTYVFDGIATELHEGWGILIERENIRAAGPLEDLEIPRGTTRIDLPDHTVLPGLVDLHNYLSIDPDKPDPMGQMYGGDMAARAWVAARQLRKDLLSGVTTLRVMGEGAGFDVKVRNHIEAGDFPGPRLLTSGQPITPTHGHQAPPQGYDGPEGVRYGVRQNLKLGVDWIKVCATGGTNSLGLSPTTPAYTREEIRVAVEEAHRTGRSVAAAAMGGEAVRIAMEEGVRTIEHGTLLDADQVEAIIKQEGYLVLTPSRFFHPMGIEYSARNLPVVLEKLNRARETMRRFIPEALKSGLRIVLGTDNMHGRIAFRRGRGEGRCWTHRTGPQGRFDRRPPQSARRHLGDGPCLPGDEGRHPLRRTVGAVRILLGRLMDDMRPT
jgi:imidazolonepropionase-like amidohydrolase